MFESGFCISVSEISSYGPPEGVRIDDDVLLGHDAGRIAQLGQEDGSAAGGIVPADPVDMTGEQTSVRQAMSHGGYGIRVGGESDAVVALPGTGGTGNDFEGFLGFLPFAAFIPIMQAGGEFDDGVGGGEDGTIIGGLRRDDFEDPLMCGSAGGPDVHLPLWLHPQVLRLNGQPGTECHNPLGKTG